MSTTRREFLNETSKIVAGAGLMAATPSSLPSFASIQKKLVNEKITVGLIGAKGMGFANLQDALKVTGVECAAICDVDDTILNQRTADTEKIQGKAPLKYKDFRKLIENKDIDAIIIGTPDHWHCLPFIYGCQSGKDIYVEKPMANSIGECNLMVRAARKYNRVVQVGTQRKSTPHLSLAESAGACVSGQAMAISGSSQAMQRSCSGA